MKALVVYDSAYGNTAQVAQAMGETLGSQMDVEVLRVTDVQPEQLRGLDVLLVGSPTQAFQPLPTIKEFLKNIPAQGLEGVKVAAFDTRIPVDDVESPIGRFALRFFVRLFGYAAEPIGGRLRKKGGELMVPPEGFFVEGTEGPLTEGELERAAEWAKALIALR